MRRAVSQSGVADNELNRYIISLRRLKLKKNLSVKASQFSRLMASNNTASIAQARKLVEQLKMEANIDRIKVSKAAADLMSYCEAHAKEDPLLSPVPASENPFREKKFFCAIL
ncbi:hypothetical protein AMELA_G00049100 [Ameiurus melas]|uniref:Guanine nucleotide-binding protein subunit gamma n=1 Tax=Ameiurus melas TaxID=219545 RepID=A0A7J6B731_AMEME|nr:hypothetical protein AMELA_G00049100 [Ameiurus melas]